MTMVSAILPSETAHRLLESIESALNEKNTYELVTIIDSATPVDLRTILRRFEQGKQIALWSALINHSPILAANLLDHLSDTDMISLVSALSQEDIVPLFERLSSADRRLLLGQLPHDKSIELKRLLPIAFETEERAALQYPTYSAGGISKSEVIKLHSDAVVADLAELLRKEDKYLERLEWRYVYLVRESGEFLGALKIRDVMMLPFGAMLRYHIDDSIPICSPELGLQELKAILDATLHSVVPVIDSDGFQIGVVGFKHLNEALYLQSEQQRLEQSGVFGGDESRTMPWVTRNLRRLAFLLPSVVLSYAAVSIIAAYEPLIEQIAVLAALLPLVANLSGAAGNQAVAVSIRELSTGDISSKDLLYVALKEVPIGALNGLAIGTVLGGLAWILGTSGHVALPMLIGLAYAISSTMAVLIGGTLPLLLKHCDLDPAMLSSPLLTTLTDAFAFFSVLYLAQLILL
ncbi:magnesium transporter [Vibrio mexicanus]|uniref:magnesium transporter n=1 Tax=Vibrio mexicanus TaxID=1004326 RepID=UPI00063CC071|nr:magnesium transporter [Vibrio mexicanus]